MLRTSRAALLFVDSARNKHVTCFGHNLRAKPSPTVLVALAFGSPAIFIYS